MRSSAAMPSPPRRATRGLAMRASKPLLHARGRLVTLTPCMMREISGRIHAASRRATDIFSGQKDHSSFCHTASSRARTPAAANIAALMAASIPSSVGFSIPDAIPSGISAAAEAAAAVAAAAVAAAAVTVAEAAASAVAVAAAVTMVAGAEAMEEPLLLASLFACRSQKSTHLIISENGCYGGGGCSSGGRGSSGGQSGHCRGRWAEAAPSAILLRRAARCLVRCPRWLPKSGQESDRG